MAESSVSYQLQRFEIRNEGRRRIASPSKGFPNFIRKLHACEMSQPGHILQAGHELHIIHIGAAGATPCYERREMGLWNVCFDLEC
jgi:hypothetical protein